MPVKKEEEKKLTPKKRTPKTTAKSEKEKVEVKQETRAYLESQMITVGMRMKEDADDYRFITDPDLPPMQISDETIQRILDTMPEAPHNKVKRFVEDYGIDQESAKVLTSELDLAIAYEEVVKEIMTLAEKVKQENA